MTGIAERLAAILDPNSRGQGARLFGWLHLAATSVGLAAMILDTLPAPPIGDPVLNAIMAGVWGFFLLEGAARLFVAPLQAQGGTDAPTRARLLHLRSTEGLIDLLAVLAPGLALAAGLAVDDVRLFCAVWALKYIRYSVGLGLMLRVLRQARASLLSVLTVFFVVLLLAATLAYIFERKAQPEAFGSIPAAMWWAIVSLTTTGYGDAVPQTLWGRLLAGVAMMGGIAVFALWAGILATAFAEELRRRTFLRTWDLVVKVPFFQEVGAGVIADIVQRLRPLELPKGALLFRRGQRGDCMYFIVEGSITIDIQPQPIRLVAGQFFGEIALVTGGPRTASASAAEPTQLLVLDIADFRELASRRPELVKAIEVEAKRRLDENAAAAAMAALRRTGAGDG
ncbi:MAG: ion transporter [Alphaproteobacteria bacterium]|nr:ion transporter [Alphaproteobacteria bacterium]